MAQSTFGDVWRRVRLHAPGAGFGLVRGWVQTAFEELSDRRPWVWAIKQTSLSTLAARAVTANLTQGSQSITSAAAFLASDVGRQFRVGTFPFYTIISVLDASNARLDLPYAGDTASPTGQILSAYVTLPEDFGAFMLVVDPVVQRQINWWTTQEQLTQLDPMRISSGDLLRTLVPTTQSPVPATLGYARAEWWPSPTTARQVPAWYRSRPAQLADTDPLPGVLAGRGSVLETGALAACAKWPGTAEAKNPYFNPQLAKTLSDEFDRDCAKLELRDDDQAQQSWVALPYHQWPCWGLSGGTDYLRATDATVGDYANFGL